MELGYQFFCFIDFSGTISSSCYLLNQTWLSLSATRFSPSLFLTSLASSPSWPLAVVPDFSIFCFPSDFLGGGEQVIFSIALPRQHQACVAWAILSVWELKFLVYTHTHNARLSLLLPAAAGGGGFEPGSRCVALASLKLAT